MASSCQQSLVCHRAEVLPLPFVVLLSLIVASGHYLLTLQSCSAFSTTKRLNGDCDFSNFPCYSVLLSCIYCPLLLGCLVIVAKVIKIVTFHGDFCIFFAAMQSHFSRLLVWKGLNGLEIKRSPILHECIILGFPNSNSEQKEKIHVLNYYILYTKYYICI